MDTEITFDIIVEGNTLSGTETLKLYDADEKPTEWQAGPAFQGKRVTLP